VWQPRAVQFEAPRAAEPTSDERELLLRYLHRQREEVVAAAAGLTDEQARWTPDGRLLPSFKPGSGPDPRLQPPPAPGQPAIDPPK